MGWILHPRICAFPDLAQALCNSLRSWWRFMRYCVYNNINRILQQVLQQHALDIAKTYTTDPESWLGAAQNLRAPYWDWATNSVPPPEVISLQTVNIIAPNGQTTSVPNPLYQYTFNPIDPSFPAPWKFWRTTIRHPDNPDSPNATTDAQALIT
jgi:tyrosinase